MILKSVQRRWSGMRGSDLYVLTLDRGLASDDEAMRDLSDSSDRFRTASCWEEPFSCTIPGRDLGRSIDGGRE